MKSTIGEVSKGWLRSFLATEMMGWHEDGLAWRDQDGDIRARNWRPDEDWEHFGWMLDALPDEEWCLHLFIAEGGGWMCEAQHEGGEGIAGDPSFRLAICMTIAKVMGWGKEGKWGGLK